jgi:hypothetical protein
MMEAVVLPKRRRIILSCYSNELMKTTAEASHFFPFTVAALHDQVL